VDETGDAQYEYQGTSWALPAAMVALQIEIERADAACKAAVAAGDDAALAAAREMRLSLVVEKYRVARPWWDTFENYERWRADWALKAYVAALPEFVSAAADAGG
jgi:hypothetical protein